MDIVSAILIVFGLAIFEIVSSIDNAIVNADILARMSERAKKLFLTWGLLIAVFLVRGVLPLLILYLTNPSLGILRILTAAINGSPVTERAIEEAAPVILIAGGVFLIFLFLHWLFMEPKSYGLRGEEFFESHGIWFFAVASIILTIIVWFAIQQDKMLAFGAVVGSTAFFIVDGFKQNAELKEKEIMEGKVKNLSDLSKLLYLEIIDATFSIDGVIGAFAFTLSVPLILIGNGLGALIVRELTIRNVETIKRYVYLKNGAMYSIFILGIIMLLESFGFEVPAWLSPIATFMIVGFFLWKSIKENKISKNSV